MPSKAVFRALYKEAGRCRLTWALSRDCSLTLLYKCTLLLKRYSAWRYSCNRWNSQIVIMPLMHEG